jgi:alkyl sulfatase BDS1-like metallo-beta-lactamase superfamily hydrolase
MMEHRSWTAFLGSIWILMLISACSPSQPPDHPEVESHGDLLAHSAEFKQEVIKVTDGVYVAIGFGLANAVLLVGDDGVVILDTMESAEAARPVKEAFDDISTQPVKAIIYTHFHPDHTGGAAVMAGKDKPEVYAHEGTQYYLNRIATITRETTYRRSMRQFGSLLPQGDLVNCGIGPELRFNEDSTLAVLTPTRTFGSDPLELEIAGIKIVLMHAPGETPDQILIWLPQKKILFPADNFYKSFPNLYAIRGTAYRDVSQWVKSLDKMRTLKAEYLVPHHTRPIVGSDTIYETLTHYRDAIQFVHDQTIRLMNQGLTPLEIVAQVKLPPHLARQPYLHEYYGTVPWSVRAVFDGYLGWFGGNATDLFPLSPREKAKRFVQLAGSEKNLMTHARQAVTEKDYQWALVLCDQLLQINPESLETQKLKAISLRSLGAGQIAATARNYYLTQALEVENKRHIGMMKIKDKTVLQRVTLEGIFNGMAVKLDPEKSADVNMTAGFRFPDTGESFGVYVRRGVAEIQPYFPDNPDISLTVDSIVWKEVVTGFRNPAMALVKDVDKEGGMLKVIKFLSLFR